MKNLVSGITMQKVDFPNFREGWSVPPDIWRSHYMVRYQLTNTVQSLCGRVEREIIHHGNGLNALWEEGSFTRCKSCQRMKNRR